MISIIIPTFNEEKLVKKTVEDFAKGLILSHEIIVSDDESSDRTLEIAEGLPGVQAVTNSHAGGKPRTVASNRNNGARYAVGEFLAFFDASCHVENPSLFFSQALENFKDETVVAVTGWVLIEPGSATWVDKIILGIINRGYIFTNNVLHKGTATGKFQMFRKDAFMKIRGYNEKLVTCEDIDIFKRMSAIGKTRFDRRLSVFHPGRREHAIGWTRLLAIWTINNIWVILFNKALAKEWAPVR